MTQLEWHTLYNGLTINEVKSEGRVENLEKNSLVQSMERNHWYWSCSMGNTWTSK